MSTTDKLTFARSLRSIWRDDEEEYTLESFEYAKRSTVLIDYLADIANENYSIKIETPASQFVGSISFVGTDYFELSQTRISKEIIKTYFPLANANELIIRIENKNIDYSKYNVVPKMKSFSALVDELSVSKSKLLIEVLHNEIITGKIEIFKDFIRIAQSDKSMNKKETYIEKDTTLITCNSIIAVTIAEVEK